MKYRVHCYVTVRVPIDVEASDHTSAMRAAEAQLDEHSFRLPEAEDAEETTGYLVDEINDNVHQNSRNYDAKMQPA